MKLVVAVEVQTYGDNEEEVLAQIRDAILAVVSLAELSVGTFIVSTIEEE